MCSLKQIPQSDDTFKQTRHDANQCCNQCKAQENGNNQVTMALNLLKLGGNVAWDCEANRVAKKSTFSANLLKKLAATQFNNALSAAVLFLLN